VSDITAVLAAAFLAEALAVGFVMRRRGFDGYIWTLLGLFLGPIAVAIAISFALRAPRRRPRIVRAGARAGRGATAVLVGYDGSPTAAAAVGRVPALLGERAGRVVIARVVPLDAPPGDERAAEEEVSFVIDAHPELHASGIVLYGEPAHALQDYALDAGLELVVVGASGSGWSTVMGSVASSLARESAVPVLIVDNHPAALPSS